MIAGPSPSTDDPRRRLARSALSLLVIQGAAPRPSAWDRPVFCREVELIRRHLAPLRSRAALAASFGREGFHVSVPDDREALARSPAAVAYAIRWLELSDGAARPMWPEPLAAELQLVQH